LNKIPAGDFAEAQTTLNYFFRNAPQSLPRKPISKSREQAHASIIGLEFDSSNFQREVSQAIDFASGAAKALWLHVDRVGGDGLPAD
jgi:hypothetical protein